MGLKSSILVVFISLIQTQGCVGLRTARLAEKSPGKFYYDCCSPSLQRDAKNACKVAKQYPNCTIVDENGDRHIFIWSACEPGKERWRDWEDK